MCLQTSDIGATITGITEIKQWTKATSSRPSLRLVPSLSASTPATSPFDSTLQVRTPIFLLESRRGWGVEGGGGKLCLSWKLEGFRCTLPCYWALFWNILIQDWIKKEYIVDQHLEGAATCCTQPGSATAALLMFPCPKFKWHGEGRGRGLGSPAKYSYRLQTQLEHVHVFPKNNNGIRCVCVCVGGGGGGQTLSCFVYHA